MATPLLEAEGTWSEITEKARDFADQRLHVIVLSAGDKRETIMEPSKDTRPIMEVLAEIAASAPKDELAKLPPDFTDQLDHYIYGSPKR